MKKKKIIIAALVFVFSFFAGVMHAKAAFSSNSIKSFKIKNKAEEYAVGDKVYIDLELNKNFEFSESSKMILYFTQEGNNYKTETLGLSDLLTDEPYFMVFTGFEQGETYYLSKINMVDNVNGRSWYFSDPEEKAPEGSQGVYLESLKDVKFKVKLKNKVTNFSLTSGSEAEIKKGTMTFNLETAKKAKVVKITLQNKSVKMYHQTVQLALGDGNEATLDMTQVREPYVIPGDYYISKLYLEPDDSNESVTYSLCNGGSCSANVTEEILLHKSIDIKLTGKLETNLPQSDEEANAILQDIILLDKSGSINSKINLYINSKLTLIQATLTFTNESGSITVNVKDLDTQKPYFIIPFTSEPGAYSLDYAILKASNGKEYQFRKGEAYYNIQHFDFKASLFVNEGISGGQLFSLENEKIDEEVINKIKKLDSNIVIEIDANNNSIISSELFEAVKGVNKTLIFKYRDIEWTFNGLDITDPKQIDVSTSMNIVGDDLPVQADIKYNGIVVNFADNKKLPGKCLIKVYNTETISKIMNEKDANIYYLNEETGKYDIIKLRAQYSTEGFYEFYINHNSKYFITTETVDEQYVGEDLSVQFNPKASFTQKQLIYCSIAVALVFIILLIIIAAQAKSKKKLQQAQQK